MKKKEGDAPVDGPEEETETEEAKEELIVVSSGSSLMCEYPA